jgi:phage baseplate assembly protein V
MIRFGFVSGIEPETGKVRVRFVEDDLVTAPLPMIFPATSGDEYFVLPDENTQVAVLMDNNAEDGVVLGAIYSSEKKPSQGAADKTYVKFKDGTVISYDRSGHKYTVTMDTVTYEISRNGFAIKRGEETLKKILSDLIDELVIETHTTPSGTSGPPINIAAYNAIKARLPNLLTQ